jgi:hypothetical protein
MLGATVGQLGVNFNTYLRPKTYVVLEDDVDLEWNIKKFLVPIWDALPNDWEVVMIGQHCPVPPYSALKPTLQRSLLV